MRVWSTVLAAMFVIGCAAPADADWFHDFNDGQIPANWEFDAPPIFPPASADVADASSGYLAISESVAPDQGGTPVVRGVNKSESFSDVRVSGTIHLDPNVGTIMGLGARDTGLNAYIMDVGFAPNADMGVVSLGRGGPPGTMVFSSHTYFGIPTRLDIEASYYLEFEVVGDRLTGRVFDAPGGDELIKLTYTDPNPIEGAGFAGVFTGTADGFEHLPTAGTFDNISAVAIPEPSSVALLVMGLVGIAGIAKSSARAGRPRTSGGPMAT